MPPHGDMRRGHIKVRGKLAGGRPQIDDGGEGIHAEDITLCNFPRQPAISRNVIHAALSEIAQCVTHRNMDETPADRLRQARIARGYKTARQFSDTHGFAQSTYSTHETGARKLTRDTALRYAEILEISIEWLLTGKGNGLAEVDYAAEAPEDKEENSLLDDLEIIGAHDPDERANYEAMIRNRAAAVRARRQRDSE